MVSLALVGSKRVWYFELDIEVDFDLGFGLDFDFQQSSGAKIVIHLSYPHLPTGFSCMFFLIYGENLMKKEISTNFYGVLGYFCWTYKVSKFWVTKLFLNVIDIIHANKHAQYTNYGFHINFWNFFLMPFSLMTKKDFKQNLLHWPQFPFNATFLNELNVSLPS